MHINHLTKGNNKISAGTHIIADFWECENLDNLKFIEQQIINAATKAGATILHIHLHSFAETNGITGVAILAESHISIHTWPEINYAAFDIFMCGKSLPEIALQELKSGFKPQRIEHKIILRGEI